MSERPILFSGPMIRALLDGSKTQTRRVVKPQPPDDRPPMIQWGSRAWNGAMYTGLKPVYGAPGDRLWVRESWQFADWTEDGQPFVRFAADNAVRFCEGAGEGETLVDTWAALSATENYEIDNKAADRRWRPSIFMPRWASRITLTITDVRVERLQEISEADAIAEGCVAGHPMTELDLELMRGTEVYELAKELGIGSYPSAKFNYSMLWDSINAKHAPWPSNPWVWVLTFEVKHG